MSANSRQKLAVFCSSDALRDILECPVCLEIPQSHIWNCSNGHFICSSCRNKINNKCVLCRSKYTKSRNFLLEAIIATCKFTCEFKMYGCVETVTGNYIRQHRNNCYYRPMICYLGKTDDCNFTIVNYKDYFGHLVTQHGIFQGKRKASVVLIQSTKSGDLDERQWITISKPFHNEIFLFRSFKIKSDIYWSVAVTGNEDTASKFIASIKILHQCDKKSPKELSTNVHSIRHSRYKFRRDLPHAKLAIDKIKKLAQSTNTQNQPKLEWKVEFSVSLKSETL